MTYCRFPPRKWLSYQFFFAQSNLGDSSLFQVVPQIISCIYVWIWLGHFNFWTCFCWLYALGRCPARNSLKSFTATGRFSGRNAFISALTKILVPAKQKHPHTIILPPPYVTMGWRTQRSSITTTILMCATRHHFLQIFFLPVFS